MRRAAAAPDHVDPHIVEHLNAAGLGALADLGFLGLADTSEDPVVITGYGATKKRKLTAGQKRANT
ncbi:hypothetical protein ABH926_009170 [Catenulispora sp. GP43]|uniref:hypothetical protein n=1 Tax=Catenulispora sp. GP43 TaxID=3156263 RepID=UPI003514E440